MENKTSAIDLNTIDPNRIMLEATDIIKQYKQYDDVVTAVNRASIKVHEGEFVAIIGSSGSGKSTFMNICAGLDKPNAGSVKIRSREITKMGSDELNRYRGMNIGVVFQKHNLIPQFTAYENILVPTMMCRRDEFSYEEHLKKLIPMLGLSDRLHHLPSELSGGQQQRVAIARALINMPQILFADEPTGNLDRKNADEVLELLLETRAQIGLTLVMVTHDMKIAKRADTVYTMDNGYLLSRKINFDEV
ncbi:MAG: ABC transporter ATP-binding protein [Clostridia bacterium]|nr:ABC transporter ATP-binding protein [Clostridia bacterium]MBR4032093.1 ABC transporter ATP-binding protein [Clostridia bacterium]